MQELNPLVSIIVVSYKRFDDLKQCLELLLNYDYPHKEIIVVDNNDDNGALSQLKSHFPQVSFVRPNKNLGASGGRNYGLRVANGEFCMFVDDDVLIRSDNAIARALSHLKADASIAGVSFQILNSDGSPSYSANPRFDKKLLDAPFFCATFCGSACVFKISALRRAGLFWDDLFIGCEELDLAFRLINGGYKILHDPDLIAMNKESDIGRTKDRFIYYYSSNRYLVALRNLPIFYFLSTSIYWWSFLFVEAVKNRQVGSFMRGIKRSLMLTRGALKIRRKLGRPAVDYLKKHSGRLYY